MKDLKCTPPMTYEHSGYDVDEVELKEVDRVRIVRGNRYSYIEMFKGDKVVVVEIDADMVGGYLPDIATTMSVEVKGCG